MCYKNADYRSPGSGYREPVTGIKGKEPSVKDEQLF